MIASMAGLDPEIQEYYERGREAGRLAGEFPSGPLELARTQELILRRREGRPRYSTSAEAPVSTPSGWPTRAIASG